MNVAVDQKVIHLDLSYLEDSKVAATRAELAVLMDRGCVRCGAPPEPEPTDEERAKIFADPDFNWFPPDGTFLFGGFGLMGGGYGPYVNCDGCGLFLKCDLGPEAE